MSLPSFFDILNNTDEPSFLKKKVNDIQLLNNLKEKEPSIEEEESEEDEKKEKPKGGPIITSKAFIKSELFI